ncbi:hypothetical protein FDP41_010992 [Naegleria fowleri]|uniref:Smr domain-containing protein n=1 Tax=Naegleria fowleri TaxID=5763 RepID=A0A6A5C915_NAEFO|nr:uncharacterized protein FDP41_010992 [Naegleria fowleri]KAF0983014.1 hypothetical protein FDP41_010992 [Naegleria fowleri]
MLDVVVIVFLSLIPILLQKITGELSSEAKNKSNSLSQTSDQSSSLKKEVVVKPELQAVNVPKTSSPATETVQSLIKKEAIIEKQPVVAVKEQQLEKAEPAVVTQATTEHQEPETRDSSSRVTTIETSDIATIASSNNKEAQTSTTEFQNNLDESNGSFILKPSKIVKYIIGPSGSVIKQIMIETNSRIDITDRDESAKLIKISSNGSDPSLFNLRNTYHRMMEELNKYGWAYDAQQDEFVEHLTESMKLFKELEQKIKEQSEIMSKCFAEASEAFQRGEKALASQLSEEGKQAQELMKQYQSESAHTMFEHLNKDRTEDEIDLHGQYVDFAMKFLKERIDKLKQQNKTELTIIYGAGNHSDENGPKIKPAVLKYLGEVQMKYEEKTQGSILAFLQ